MVQEPDRSARGDEPDAGASTDGEHTSGETDSRQGNPVVRRPAEPAQIDEAWRDKPHLELIKTVFVCISADVLLICGEMLVDYLKRQIDQPSWSLRACLAITQVTVLVAFLVPLLYLVGFLVRVVVKPTGNYLSKHLQRVTPKLVVKHAAAASLGVAVVFGAALALAAVFAAWPWIAALGITIVGGLLYLIHKLEVERAHITSVVVVIVATILYALSYGAVRIVDILYPVN